MGGATAAKSFPPSVINFSNETKIDPEVCSAESSLGELKQQLPSGLFSLLRKGNCDFSARGDGEWMKRRFYLIEITQRAHPDWDRGSFNLPSLEFCLLFLKSPSYF